MSFQSLPTPCPRRRLRSQVVTDTSAAFRCRRHAFGWGQWNVTLQTQSVSAHGPMAVERGKYVLRFTAGPAAPPGMRSFEDRGNYLVHWRRESDNHWRVVADAPVSELPLPGT